MRRRLRHIIHDLKRAALVAALFLFGTSVLADDVTVRSAGGGLEISGRILDFDGQFLHMTSSYGPVAVLYENVVCVGSTCPDGSGFVPTIRVAAPRVMAEVTLPALLQRFAAMRSFRTATQEGVSGGLLVDVFAPVGPVVRFEIAIMDADEAFADLLAFESDVIFVRREIQEDEAERASAGRVTLSGESAARGILGFDALIPIVAPTRSVGSVSIGQLSQIYRGELSDWSDLGGANGPIRLHVVYEMPGWGIPDATQVSRHLDFETAVAAVVADPNAVGLVSFQNGGFAQQVNLTDVCGLVASPNATNVKTQDYPLTRPVYLYHADRRMPDVSRAFLDWLTSPQAQLVVRRSGLVDTGLVPLSLDTQGQRFVNALRRADSVNELNELRALAKALEGRTRLSMSFRFLPGGVRLDEASQALLLRLSEQIASGDFDGRSLMMLGFSDGNGDADQNRRLSERRAAAVRQILDGLIDQGLPDTMAVDIAGFGEVLPVGCDETAWGRQQNRRVELWVGD